MRLPLALLGSALLILLGCSGVPPSAGGTKFSVLAGTGWQLKALHSMDDAQGTTSVADPNRYTLQFHASGKLTLRLDCNLGHSTWETATSSESSGRLVLGPIASTRARCGPPHLDERLARDLAHIRSYFLKDGKLFLSLMADGGIYEWVPLQ